MIPAAAVVLAVWTLSSNGPEAPPKEPAPASRPPRPAADPGAASRLRPGLFLYAAPNLQASPFAETVVLLIEHAPEGSMGLVVNRPTDHTLDDALDKPKGKRARDVRLYWGGPVQPEAVFALVRSRGPRADAPSVLPGVQLTGDLDEVRRAQQESPLGAVRAYSGYAGWAAGQLRDEVRAGAWVLDRADADSVFAADPSSLWRKVYRLLERQQVRGSGGEQQRMVAERDPADAQPSTKPTVRP